jgi:hypothetical protein
VAKLCDYLMREHGVAPAAAPVTPAPVEEVRDEFR